MAESDKSAPGANGGQSTMAASGVRVPMKIRLHPETRERAGFWAQRHDFPSVNEYITEAVEEKIARESGDFDVPNLSLQRLNQLIDRMVSLESSHENLATVVVSLSDTLLRLTRGDNYLLNEEDGELEETD